MWIQTDIKSDFNNNKDLYLKNLDVAVDKIIHHINNNNRIKVFTDYDVDGITSAVIFDWLFNKLKCEYEIKIPNRKEGYGLNRKWIEENLNIDLIITADNGISKLDEVDFAIENNIDVLVTDHHLQGEKLPNCVVVNPKIGSSEFLKDLCGCGVSFYIVRAVCHKMKLDCNPNDLIDIVAIATIADMVELNGANRQIVIAGLKKINNKIFSYKSLELLFSKFKDNVKSQDIAFGISPIINAIGRVNDPKLGFDFLTDRNLELYDMLIKTNEDRKTLQSKYYLDALKNIDKDDKIIIYENNDISKGLVGLVAGDMSNKFNKPTIVISNNHGSGRSVNDINLHDLVFNKNKEFVINGGGHEKAIGVCVSNVTDFKKQIIKYCNKNINDEDIKKRYTYWKEIEYNELENVYDFLSTLEPFGMGNPAISIVIRNFIVTKYDLLGKLKNVLKLYDERKNIEAIRFKCDMDVYNKLKIGSNIDILGKISKNTFRGKDKYILQIEDIKY